MDNERIIKLENVIKQMLTPLKSIPLDLVIEWLSWYKIIPFNKSDEKDTNLLLKLKQVANLAWKNVNAKWILRPRPNEVARRTFRSRARWTVWVADVNKDGKWDCSALPKLELFKFFKRMVL